MTELTISGMKEDQAVHARAPEAGAAEASALQQRDEKIEQLERTLAQERQQVATLRAAAEELRFKVDILEKSYSKQLEDARQSRDKAESDLAAMRAREAELGTGAEDTLKLLEEARAEIARVSAERDDLRSRLARSDKREPWRVAKDVAPVAHDRTLTIDDMLATSSWRVERKSAGEGHLNAQVNEEPEAPAEMISPDLVFASDRKDGDEES